MGTNYYWHDSPCDSCGRHETIHVGKSSGGWSLLFRAWPHELVDSEFPDWGYDPSSPFGFPVVSRADWRKVFRERRGLLVSEYGTQIDDPVAWLEALQAPDKEQIAKEAGWLAEGRYWREPDPRDADGFRFCREEFS